VEVTSFVTCFLWSVHNGANLGVANTAPNNDNLGTIRALIYDLFPAHVESKETIDRMCGIDAIDRQLRWVSAATNFTFKL
jgi:hypothetical protein